MTHDAQDFQLRSPAVLVIGNVAACQVFGAMDTPMDAPMETPMLTSTEPVLRRRA
jgi:uroporphyrin-III C-methyltransferase